MERQLKFEAHCVGPLQNNTFLVWEPESREAAIVDPGMGSEFLADEIRATGLSLTAIANTHGHFDHVYHNALFRREFGCQLLIHEEDLPFLRGLREHAASFGFQADASPEPDGFLEEGGRLLVGGVPLIVMHTPGHSPGGVCLAGPGFVLSGDTLFAQSIGRTDLPGGSLQTLLSSITGKLFSLPDATEVLPGHGPSTSIGFEKRHNPFLRPGMLAELAGSGGGP